MSYSFSQSSSAKLLSVKKIVHKFLLGKIVLKNELSDYSIPCNTRTYDSMLRVCFFLSTGSASVFFVSFCFGTIILVSN